MSAAGAATVPAGADPTAAVAERHEQGAAEAPSGMTGRCRPSARDRTGETGAAVLQLVGSPKILDPADGPAHPDQVQPVDVPDLEPFAGGGRPAARQEVPNRDLAPGQRRRAAVPARTGRSKQDLGQAERGWRGGNR